MSKPPACASECALAHAVNGKLAVILGNCDLLSQQSTDPRVLSRLQMIREAAFGIRDRINKPMSRGQGA
jgi:hypothetical protein